MVSGTPSITTLATPASGVAGSPYVITAAANNLTAANYTFVYVNGSLTINKATSAFSATANISVVYGDGYLLTGHIESAAGVYPTGSNVAVTVTGGPDGNDTLINVERIKFLSPSHVSDINNNGFGDLVFQDNTTGAIDIRIQPVGPMQTLSGIGAFKVNGNGREALDPDSNAGLLLQDGVGNLEVITNISGATPLTTFTTTALTLPPLFSPAGWTAISAGDFNGASSSPVLLPHASGRPRPLTLSAPAP